MLVATLLPMQDFFFKKSNVICLALAELLFHILVVTPFFISDLSSAFPTQQQDSLLRSSETGNSVKEVPTSPAS